MHPQSPFAAFTFRSFLAWDFLGWAVVASAAYWSLRDVEAALAWGEHALLGATVAWLVWKFRVSGASVGCLFGRLPREAAPWRAIHVVAPLLVFAFGALYLVYYPLSYLWPAWVEDLLVSTAGPLPFDWRQDGLWLFFIVAIGPAAEEVTFRGVLLHRWTERWNLRIAVAATSLVFALYHDDVIGAFVFGSVMAELYVRTQSLLVPIIAHVLYNLAVVLGFVLVPDIMSVASLEEMRSWVWAAALCLIVSVTWLLWAIRGWRRRWPALLPYYAHAADAADTKPSSTAIAPGALSAECGK